MIIRIDDGQNLMSHFLLDHVYEYARHGRNMAEQNTFQIGDRIHNIQYTYSVYFNIDMLILLHRNQSLF